MEPKDVVAPLSSEQRRQLETIEQGRSQLANAQTLKAVSPEFEASLVEKFNTSITSADKTPQVEFDPEDF